MWDRPLRRWRRQWERTSRLADRISSLRAALFIVGTALSILLLALGIRTAAEWVALAFALAFIGAALWHRRVSEASARAALRLKLTEGAQARAALDWKAIPELPPVPPGRRVAKYFWDLDLLRGKSLLRLINVTVSSGGWHRLLDYFDSNALSLTELKERQREVGDLHRLRVLRRRFLSVCLELAGRIDTEALVALVGEKLHTPKAFRYFIAIAVVQATAVFAFGMSATRGWPPVFLLLGAIAASFYKWGGREIRLLSAYGDALVIEASLGRLLSLVEPLRRLRRAGGPELAKLLQPFEGPRNPAVELRRLERITGCLGVKQNPLLHLGVNLIFPWDFFWTMRLEKVRKEIAESLPDWLSRLAEVEALASLAEWRANHPSYSMPEFSDTQEIQAKELGHPLIPPERRVTNDFSLGSDSKCLLITGSNMSGKSTFLRSLGINLVLAKAGTSVCAQGLGVYPVRLHTSLRVEDSLEDNLSSFYAEVKELKQILESAGTGTFYLIDEIFRGTNNRERLIGSRAYMKALARTKAIGLVTTHDLELTSLADELPGFRNGHFREDIHGGKMTFSYKLSEGPCPTTNALQVMKLAGLPIEDGPAGAR